ncbi:hypothetical protein [Neorhizobium vignae]|uniref:hypothetical protein n=1 Tax=Neorhizobium vignae TaxID=690585 RepID=UPI000560E334|nr:hypothetical protein [Neorhizobium vignae]
MLSAVSSLSAAYSGSSALLLLQSVSMGQTGTDGSSYTASAGLALTSNHTASAAVDLLIRIIMDAQGKSQVEIDAEGGMATAKTGDGDDTIQIRAGAAYGVSSGGGNDLIDIVATNTEFKKPSDLYSAVDNVDSGDGNDQVLIDAQGPVTRVYGGAGDDIVTISGTGGGSGYYNPMNQGVDNIYGGAGNDTLELVSSAGIGRIGGGDGNDIVDIKAGGWVSNVDGDAGNDIIDIKANGRADGIHGGDGNDTITAQAKDMSVLDGGAGDDMIVVNASHASDIDGGDGNDTIIVTTEGFLRNISGGKGDDHVVLDNKGRTEASYYFSAGDGRDVIVTKGPLEINGFSEDGTRRLDMSKASITVDGDTMTIGFAGTTDSITVKLGGRMADAGNIHLVYRPETQSLLIADDRYIAENTPAPPVFDRSEDNHVGSFHR